jgi:glycosyltransferase involved in cell wall biosynthesis
MRLRQLVDAMVLVDRLAADGIAHLHAHFLHTPAAIAFIAKKISGQRYSLSGHAKDIYTSRPQSLRLRCSGAEFVTTCTAANERHLVHEVGLRASHVHLCRHGVDVERFSAATGPRRRGRIVSVGRLVPKKGHDVLIRACGELGRRGIDFDLRIVGAGPLRDELLAIARDEGIAGRLELTGALSQDEVIRELGRAELFALSPSVMPDGDRDGIPNVLMEAMAAGVPVVASAVSGIPELLIDRVNARLVDPGRPDLLADVLGELLSDGEQRVRLSDAGREFATRECSWSHAIVPLEALIRGLADEPSGTTPAAMPAPTFAS